MTKLYKGLVLFAVLGVLILGLMQIKQSQPKTAYVNTKKLMTEYAGMADAIKVYKEKTSEWQINLDTMISSFETTMKMYEQQRNSLNEVELDEMNKLLSIKQNQINEYRNMLQSKMQEADVQMTEDLIQEISEYVRLYGKKNNYSIVFAAGNGTIIYAEEGLDITDQILQGINQQYGYRK